MLAQPPFGLCLLLLVTLQQNYLNLTYFNMKAKDFVEKLSTDKSITVFGGQSELEVDDTKSFNAKFLSTTPEVSISDFDYKDKEGNDANIKFGTVLMNLSAPTEDGKGTRTQTEAIPVNTSLLGILQSGKIDQNETYGVLGLGVMSGTGNVYTRYQFQIDPLNEVA